LVGRRDDAPNAELGSLERESVQDDAVPAVLGIGLTTLHHDVGTEAVHRDRLGQSRVESGERALRDDEQGIAVGKAYSERLRHPLRMPDPRTRRRNTKQAAGSLQIVGEELRGGIALIDPTTAIAMNPHVRERAVMATVGKGGL